MRLAPLLILLVSTVSGFWPRPAFPLAEVGDAPALLPGQIAGGPGAFSQILGELTSASDVDLFRIQVTDASQFGIATFSPFDPQLFVFTEFGFPILGVDDLGSGLDPGFPVGDPLLVGLPAGSYFIGISAFNSEPLSSGVPLFDELPKGSYGTVAPSLLASGPLDGWSEPGVYPGPGNTFGDYRIELTGATAIPEPSSGLLVGFGITVLAAQGSRRLPCTAS